MIVYFSNLSNNTHRFVEKLEVESYRIPITGTSYSPIEQDCLLVIPTYGNGKVPGQVVKFLRQADTSLIKGVVGSGNTNFGPTFCLAGMKAAYALGVPLFHKFELLGNQDDVSIVKDIYNEQVLHRIECAA